MDADELRAAAQRWDAGMRERWQRSLPFTEVGSDRWERASGLGFGPESSVYNLSYVFGDVTVGEHTWIGPYTLLDGSGGLTIGSWCSISAGVHLYSHDTVSWALSRGAEPYRRAPTRVGDACFIGPHAVVAAGVSIADRCVIGAQAYVNRDLPANTIAVGAPARVVGEVREGSDGPELAYF
jgi:acetyltransferase-like isoleucine patch superfamily enzyme